MNDRYTRNDKVVWEIVKRMDDIIPRFWEPAEVRNKPGTYIMELRTMIAEELNKQE